MLEALINALDSVQRWLFETLLQPALFALNLTAYAEIAFDSTRLVLIGAAQILLLVIVLGSAQRLWPAEPIADKAAIRVDIVYTLLARLGGISLVLFFVLQPLADALEAQLRLQGFSGWHLDAVWPGVSDQAWVSFTLYLILFDALDYLYHRAQHKFQWLWELHAVHHSQRQMTYWSDDRNHFIDDLLRGGLFALAGMLLGVPPSQFVGLIVLTQIIQSVQHANLRWHFGYLGERLIVSPTFHRRHHAIGFGHEGIAQGCNFAVLFPVWDIVFGTADFRSDPVKTGIRDQLSGRDYGKGLLAQQWRALARIARRA